MINYEAIPSKSFYEAEMRHAIHWLIDIRDEEAAGWAWVEHIKPNEQNTAEVISALLEYEDIWEDGYDVLLAQSVNRWLIDPSKNAQLSIDWSWVLIALAKVSKSAALSPHIEEEKVRSSISECVDTLIAMQTASGGWPDNPEEMPTTSRTALAVWALADAAATALCDTERLRPVIDKGVQWLIQTQNSSDGGWGNLNATDLDAEYQKNAKLSLEELSYQSDSNAACTGYALVALKHAGQAKTRKLKDAAGFLRSSQEASGGWPVFSEVGIRAGLKYTFRHFSTAWALYGLVSYDLSDYTDETTINGLNYLTHLQDENFGGWRSSPDADNYTWATCNAIVVIKLVKQNLSDIKAKKFLDIVCEWWDLKRNESSYHFSIGKTPFAYNRATGFIFCIVFSLMMIELVVLTGQWTETALSSLSEEVVSLVKGLTTIAAAVILGLPWIVVIKSVFFSKKDGWIDSIGWVYGIITGFVLALYQFIV